MRERLVELIDNFIDTVDEMHWYSEELDERLADYLLASGCIVPPCKVGDTVYRIYTKSWIGEDKVSYFIMTECGLYYVDEKNRETSCDKFGKTVFLTREEAEKALKGSVDNA